ncbi:MAG: protein translocase subunit SecF [Acidobacteria bacterium]|nr:protein translocase subunit SecF [Acidobacteriota bacterium]
MEIFRNTNFDFLGKKWPFIIFSLVLTAAGLGSLWLKGGPAYGIDFKGGTLMYVKFIGRPPVDKIRSAISARIAGEVSVQEITGTNEVIIGTELKDEKTLDLHRRLLIETLSATFGVRGGKPDFNNLGAQTLAERLRDPLQRASVALSDQQLQDLAKRLVEFRDTPPRSGLLASFDAVAPVAGVTPAVTGVLKQDFALFPYSIRNVEIVGPKVGAELRNQALLATLYALGGMLVYIAFRFEWIYGLGAVIAVFHDTLITIGLFSIFNKEISLTVVAAILTLVGYSMNDTIVVFDRMRENLKILRREPLESLMNRSVNQTLSRTILSSGLTGLTALALWLFGGPVLNGFSLALVIGILVGTYSSVFVASPIVLFWNNFAESRGKRRRPAPPAAPAAAPSEGARKNSKAVK